MADRIAGTWPPVRLPADLAANARLKISKAGSVVGTRRQVNLVEGSGVTLTVADNAGAERVDVTIAAAGGSGTPASTVTTATYGTSPAVGTGTDYARADHDHGLPGAPSPSSVGALSATETGGQVLTMGAVSDGQVLKRVGTALVGVTLAVTLVISTPTLGRIYPSANVGERGTADLVAINVVIA